MIDLTGKNVLITGGSRGIGSACVKLFAKANAGVAFTYNKNKPAADELIDIVKTSQSLKSYQVNVKNEDEINNCINNVFNDFEKIDILVNNAGIWEMNKVDEMTIEEWNNTIQTNLTSMFLFAKAVIPKMKENKFGRIINISSTAGQRGEAEYSHYASSKGGMISFTKSLASELGKYNITTNCVAPGWVISNMTDKVFSDEKYFQQEAEKIPLGRIALPEDIAGPVLFLASDLAKHINGEILNVNGGSVLCG